MSDERQRGTPIPSTMDEEQAEALELRSGEVHAPIGGETLPG